MHRAARHEIVAFADFEADLTSGTLSRGGIRVPLQDKVFRLLAILLEHAGEIVARDELRRQLWPEGTFVDFDHNINNAVAKLRHTLDGGDALIETHGRHGYRFTAEVRRMRLDPGSHGGNGRLKMAVLPLAALDGGVDEEHLAAGITEELISTLGAHSPERLGVIARTSVLKYAGTRRSVAQIGRDLRVAFVLEGTVQVLDGRAHVSLQLIQVSDQTQLWSTKYDFDAVGLLRIQEAVAGKCMPRVAELVLRETVKV